MAGARHESLWRRRLALFVVGAVLCVSILGVTVYEKFLQGGWVTMVVTGALVLRLLPDSLATTTASIVASASSTKRLAELPTRPKTSTPASPTRSSPPPSSWSAATAAWASTPCSTPSASPPTTYKNFVFISVGVVDSGNFKGEEAMDELATAHRGVAGQVRRSGQRLGMPSTSFMAIGTDAVDELEQLCLDVVKRFPKSTFFAGQLVFSRDTLVPPAAPQPDGLFAAAPPAMGRRPDGDPADAGAVTTIRVSSSSFPRPRPRGGRVP